LSHPPSFPGDHARCRIHPLSLVIMRVVAAALCLKNAVEFFKVP
jgi:hypothetical protein